MDEVPRSRASGARAVAAGRGHAVGGTRRSRAADGGGRFAAPAAAGARKPGRHRRSGRRWSPARGGRAAAASRRRASRQMSTAPYGAFAVPNAPGSADREPRRIISHQASARTPCRSSGTARSPGGPWPGSSPRRAGGCAPRRLAPGAAVARPAIAPNRSSFPGDQTGTIRPPAFTAMQEQRGSRAARPRSRRSGSRCGASRPLAPCTVITRTSLLAESRSRLIVWRRGLEAVEEGGERGRLASRSGLVRGAQEGVDGIARLAARAAPRAARARRADRAGGDRTRTGRCVARESRQRRKRLAARARRRVAVGGVALAAPRAAIRSSPRSAAMRIRSSSVRPTSGDFSAVASVRSSSGSSAARPAATRSSTAMCSPILRRSAPATGTPSSFSARITASKAAPRLRTSTRTSPGRPDAARSRRPWWSSFRRVCAMRRATHDRRRLLLGLVDRQHPGVGLVLRRGVDDGPELDPAGRVRPRALMHGADGAVLEGQALEVAVGPRRWRRPPTAPPCAERNDRVRRTSSKRKLPLRRPCASNRRRLVLELARRGALEAVDRLLGIADREERAHALAARAAAGGEIRGDPAQDLPLLGVGVLRLVDEHVVDAAVELVEHPGGVAARQQRQRLVDQILEIERAEPRLVLLDPARISAARVNSACVRSTARGGLDACRRGDQTRPARRCSSSCRRRHRPPW